MEAAGARPPLRLLCAGGRAGSRGHEQGGEAAAGVSAGRGGDGAAGAAGGPWPAPALRLGACRCRPGPCGWRRAEGSVPPPCAGRAGASRPHLGTAGGGSDEEGSLAWFCPLRRLKAGCSRPWSAVEPRLERTREGVAEPNSWLRTGPLTSRPRV